MPVSTATATATEIETASYASFYSQALTRCYQPSRAVQDQDGGHTYLTSLQKTVYRIYVPTTDNQATVSQDANQICEVNSPYTL